MTSCEQDDFDEMQNKSKAIQSDEWPNTEGCKFMFICKKSFRGQKHLDMTYTKEQLNFTSFHVWYEYKAATQQLLNSWKDKRMTGFQLSWRIKNSSLSWTPSASEVGKSTLQIFQMAHTMRLRMNMTDTQILNKFVEKKVQNKILGKSIDYEKCHFGQINPHILDKTFSNLSTSLNGDTFESATYDEIKTGLDVFHAIIYCSSTEIKLYNFVDQLLDETSRTIVLTFVSMFHTKIIRDTIMHNLLKEFYVVLASTLNLNYGNILLATSSNAQLQAVIDNDWPFFTNNTKMVKDCLQV